MTDDQHGQGTPPGGGRWDPLPQGEYDDGATAFVNLPEGGIDALLDAMESPLAAPGHGYVPPQITVTPATAGTDPAATGTWAAPGAPVDGAQWHDPQAAEGDAATGDRFTYDPGVTGQWTYEETGSPEHPAPGHDVTGQWSIPVAGGDLPDESGEFTTSALVEQWGGTPPATLPGGAPAPWADQAIGRPWGPGVPGVPQEQDPAHPETGHGPAHEQYDQYDQQAPHGQHGPYEQAPHEQYGQQVRHDQQAQPHGEPGAGPAYQQAPGPDAYDGRFAHDASAAGRHAAGHAPERPGGAEHLPGAGAAPDPSGVPGPPPEQPADAVAARPHGEPAPGDGPVFGRPSAPDAYDGQPAHHDAHAPAGPADRHDPEPSGAPEHPAAGAAPGSPVAAGHAPEQPSAGHAPEPSGAPGHAPEQPAHEGPRSAGVPQPFPVEGYAEPPWPSDAEAADGAPPAPREHPQPGGQDASAPVSGAAGASEAPEGPGAADEAPEAAESPAEPSAADGTGQEPGAEPDPVADESAPAADAESPDGAAVPTAHDGSDAPDATDAQDAAEAPETEDAAETPDAPGTADADAPDDAAQPPAPDAAPPGAPHDDHPLATYVLRVNGTDRPVTDAWIGESLLYVLRERLGLAGAKDGCSQGECGACNVQVDGRLVASCLVPAVTAAGSEVRTVEGLAQDGHPSDVQRALARCGAVQCGFCVPGMAMTVHDLLEGNPAPTELETRQALCGNLCRCSGYRGVVDAVKEVVAEREAHSESPEPGPDGEADTPRIPHQAGPGAGGVNPSAFHTPEPHDRDHGQDGGQA
ncbi:2Fe-2S iron-sulfur cluster-binding protein [Streptomyces capillispiralis]|uniref:2Fe-2S iron-sulfur cluster-binding protein n=1 Tax=Streptomyces capillispiralis TaxID=68182 RepID=UPI00368EA087